MPKKPISATIDTKLLEWIRLECETGTKYRNKSHLIEIAILELKKKGK